MMLVTEGLPSACPAVSPLMLCDRLLTLAKDADRVGLRCAAEHLLNLASEVLEPRRTAGDIAQPRRGPHSRPRPAGTGR